MCEYQFRQYLKLRCIEFRQNFCFIHSLKIIIDLRPSFVLITLITTNRELCVKLTRFSIESKIIY